MLRRSRLHPLPHFSKQPQLRFILRNIFIGRREMREQDIDVETVKQPLFHLLRPDPQTVDPAIEHHMAAPAPYGLPAGDLPGRIEHWNGPNCQHLRRIIAIQSVEDGNLISGYQIGNRRRFAPMRDKEISATGGRKAGHDFSRSQPIGIGFNRCAAIRISGLRRKPFPV